MTSATARWRRPPARRVRAIRDRLRQVYGIPLAKPHGQPIAELILTVLSQSTNDRNRDVAYLALRERFASWEAVRDAPVDDLEEAIRPGGISKVKSARIKSILRAISETSPAPASTRGSAPGSAPRSAPASTRGSAPASTRASRQAAASILASASASAPAPAVAGGSRGALPPPSLAWLASQPVAEAQRYLTSLPGVGRKTAACVLLFALGMRDVPVDTHVSRVGTRLGLFRAGATFEELHDTMLEITPAGQELEFHVNLLRHGRRTCHARRPNCPGCALRRICPSAGAFD